MFRKKQYPTWKKVSAEQYESKEGVWFPGDSQGRTKVWVPRFIVQRFDGMWYTKWHVSSMWYGAYLTANDAKDSITREMSRDVA